MKRLPPPGRIGTTPLFLLLVALGGCGGESPGVIRTQVRDSAGVTIVESSRLPEGGEGGWTLEQSPFLSIGSLDGDTLYQLYEISGGARLADGRILLSDAGSVQLRGFGPDGTARGSWGREGEGPGEFQSIRIMGVLSGDTLVVLDGRLRRIHLFHPDLGFFRQSSIDEEVGMTFVSNGMFGDGSIVFGGGLTFGPGGDTPTEGMNRSDTPYRSASLEGALAADFGAIPGPEIFVQTQGGGGEYFISASLIPFGRRPAAHARGDRLFLGSADTYEISSYDPAGRLDRIIRVSLPLPPVSSRDVERFIEEEVAELDDPSTAPALRSSLRDMPTPETMPAFQGLVVDSEGFLWVEDFRPPGVGLRRWTVFDPEGTPRTRLSLPSSNRVLEIGQDYLMAVFEDHLGVEYLRLYSLQRGS
ncbi:MAG: hypothetical protein ACWGSQ_15700 [Longimicrobiales bacterium]